ncbi:MAG TPA: heparan-alpha-glucosaminide N-acetyltransferase domain-containing protein [Polyangia bacterium]|jgi:uncharacterized membrane protein
MKRLRAIDWLRGLVMVLMTIDHAGAAYDAHHLHGDAAWGWVPGSALPAGEFLTRWITHICAPAFVLLAGASLALSMEKRRGQPGQTAFIVKRGLFIAALDPIWMSLGFAGYHILVFQVLYAIGMSLVCMAFLRRLSSTALLGAAVAIQVFGELSARVHFTAQPLRVIWCFLFVGGPPFRPAIVAYPLVPWLSIMMAGWVLGRWILATKTLDRAARAQKLATLGIALLAVFAIVRGVDGYGNWNLYRDSLAPLQWLHVAKYPPSLSYTTLELGLTFLLLALFVMLDDDRPRPLLGPLALFGSTAFFFYVLHVHLLQLVQVVFKLDRNQYGLTKTYVAAAAVIVLLYPLCARYRRYKAAHPDGWTRYL